MRTTFTSPTAPKTRKATPAVERRPFPTTDTTARCLRTRDLGELGEVAHDALERGLLVHRDGDRHLARRDDVHRHAVLLEDGEDLRGVAMGEQHARAAHEERRHSPAHRDGPDAVPGHVLPHDRPGALRPERVLHGDRDPARHGGADRGRMEHLRPEERELGRLGIAHLRHEARRGHDARVGGQDPVHVGPDLDAAHGRGRCRGARRRRARPSSPSRPGRASSSSRPARRRRSLPSRRSGPPRGGARRAWRRVRAVSFSSASAAPYEAFVARISRGSIHTASAPPARSAAATRREQINLPDRKERIRGSRRAFFEERDSGARAPRQRRISSSIATAQPAPRLRARAKAVERRAVATLQFGECGLGVAARSLPFEEFFNPTSKSVTPAIAETTTRHGSPPRVLTRRATSRIRSADPTDVPPNLRTSVIARELASRRAPARGAARH